MKRKKDQKLVCCSTQETETNELSNKDDQSLKDVSKPVKKAKTNIPSNDNIASENNQLCPQIAVNQSNLTSQSPSPIATGQWNSLHQQNPSNFAQPAPPFWLLQTPSHALPALNSATAFQPLITQLPVPNFAFPVGYSFPGLQGPCDPSSWWGQAQQSQPLCAYGFAGPHSYASPTLSSAPEQLFQRGLIKPPAKISQMHQRLWDAQSAENVQLWNVINQLQSEVTDYKNRLVKLEAEVSSLKPKRGRPKRMVYAINAVTSPEESRPQARGRKQRTSKTRVQSQSKARLFEKVVLDKIEDEEKGCHLEDKSTRNKETDQNISSTGMNAANCSFAYTSATRDGDIGWPDNVASEFLGANAMSKSSRGFYHNGNVIRQGGKLVPGWSFVDEDGALGEVRDALRASANGQNDEMEDIDQTVETVH